MTAKTINNHCTIFLTEDDKYSNLKYDTTINLETIEKITLDFASVKRLSSHILNMAVFIRKNFDNLYINVKSDFDGMADCCEARHAGFVKVKKDETEYYQSNKEAMHERTLGIPGAWFVGSSRDYLKSYDDSTFKGFEVSNCCGHFILAIKK